MIVERSAVLPSVRTQLVEETSRALETATGLEAVVKVALNTMVLGIADLGVLVLDHAPDGHRVELIHARSHLTPHARNRISETLEGILASAIPREREGRTARWIPSVTDASLGFAAHGDQSVGPLLRELDIRSLMTVALRTGGRTIGGIALARSSASEPFHAADFATAQVLGRRIALAIDAAWLEDSLRLAPRPSTGLGDAIQKWARVFDLSWWGAALVDGVDRRIDTVNPAFAKLHGYRDPASLAGRLFSELLPADRVAEPAEWWSEGEAKVYESVHLRRDGVAVPVLVSVTPLDADAHPGAYLVTVQDLSDLKRTEERLQRAQRTEAVGRLAGGVAHEVNNMMTIILGFSDLLSRERVVADEHQREVDEIRKAAMRAARITTQLLAFSRQQELQPGDLRLNSVIDEMVPVLRLMLPVNIRVEMALTDQDRSVRADKSQLEQVLINLAFNARDAMVGGGTIRIVSEFRRLDEADGRRLIGIPIPAGRYGVVSVVDTGHGMDTDTVAKVFEPFFTTKPVGSGTGLGLSTVYGIVKQSGGYVWVESAPGQGTSFSVCLPEVRTAREDVGDESSEAEVLPEAGGLVLILEDEEAVRELAARILSERGYHVIQARSGAEALALLRERRHRPNLVLTDVIVPDMGMGELEAHVRKLHPDLPILYMSGYPRDDILYRGLLREDQPFLQKPFTGSDLVLEVAKMLPYS